MDNFRQIAGGGDLAGAKGLTLADQDAIDDANAALCSTRIWNKRECTAATVASDQRRRELARTEQEGGV